MTVLWFIVANQYYFHVFLNNVVEDTIALPGKIFLGTWTCSMTFKNYIV